MRIKDQPIAVRPREMLLSRGAESLPTEDLLAIIISSGTKGKSAIEISREILKKFGKDLLLSSIEDLASIKGLGKVKAIKLKAAFEIGLRYAEEKEQDITITKPKDVYNILHEYINKRQEHLILLTLNARNNLISKKVITVGTLDSSLFHPREIFAESIADRAAKIIIAHNHPSGNLNPSVSDIEMTKSIISAGEILGIKVIDSIIFGKEGYKSILNS